MTTNRRIIALAVAAALGTAAMSSPAAAFGFGPFGFFGFGHKPFFFKPFYPKFPHHKPPVGSKPQAKGGGGSSFPWVVACTMGSAGGLIFAAAEKGRVNGNPSRIIPQWEFDAMTPQQKVPFPLTSEQAGAIGFSCGLATGPVVASFQKK